MTPEDPLPTSRHANGGDRTWKLFLLVLVTLVSFSFFGFFGTGDVMVFHQWIAAVREHGWVAGYAASGADYPPLSLAMLDVAARVSEAVGGNEFMGIKALIALFLCLSSAAVYAYTSSLLLACAAELALSYGALALGYMDVGYTPTLILALSALKRSKFGAFAVLYTLSLFIKWQCVIVLPFMWIYAYRCCGEAWSAAGIKRFSKSVVAPSAVVVAAVLATYGSAVPLALRRSVTHALLSAQGMNFNWIVTYVLHVFAPGTYGPLKNGVSEIIMTVPDGIALVSRGLFAVGYLAALYLAAKRENTFENLLVCSLLGFVAHFTFSLGVHENHLYVAAVLAFLLWLENRKRGVMAAFVMLFLNVNLFLFYGMEGLRPRVRTLGGVETTVLGAVVWVAFAVAFFASEIVAYVRAERARGVEARVGEV